MTWRDGALCRGQGSLFFASLLGRGAYRDARALCAACSVQPECLDYVMTVEDPLYREGFWAGLTPRGRRAEAARRRVDAGWRELERSWRQGEQQRERLRFAREVFA